MRVKWFAPVLILCIPALCALPSCGGGGPSNDFSFYYISSTEYFSPDNTFEPGFMYLAGGTSSDIKWNYLVNPDGEVDALDFSADGTEVILRTTTIADGPGLYLADLTTHTGGQLLKIDSPFQPDSDYPAGFRFSPDGRWVIFIAKPDSLNLWHVFAVNIEDGYPKNPIDLFPDQLYDTNIVDFEIGANGDVVFSLDRYGIDTLLYHIDIRGEAPGPPARLASAGGAIYGFTPNGELFLYSTQDRKLHIAKFGSTGVESNRVIPGASDGSAMAFAPDSSRVAYADFDSQALFAIHLNGGETPVLTRINSAARKAWNWEFSRDSRFLVYTDAGNGDIYSVTFDGDKASDPVQISKPESDPLLGNFSIAPNGNFVAYFADNGTDYSGELLLAPTDGKSGPVSLNDHLPPEYQGVTRYVIPEDSSRVVFSALNYCLIDALFAVDANNGRGGEIHTVFSGTQATYPLIMFESGGPLLYASHEVSDCYGTSDPQLRIADLNSGESVKSKPVYPTDPGDPGLFPVLVGNLESDYAPPRRASINY